MDLNALVTLAARLGASDLHVEAGLPVAVRVGSELLPLTSLVESVGGTLPAAPPTREQALALARQVLSAEEWARFEQRGSADKALGLAGRRCRVNVLRSARGPGLALRLLPTGGVSLESLNLHPDLGKLVEVEQGLVLISGPTGCGKSSTLAALVAGINERRSCHILTIEQPVEFEHRPRRAFVRQREVGRDTPSFEQGLLDALREDIDVLLVGELRERETMRLTLDACETGHLVLATLHSGSVVDALQRLIASFPSDEQPAVCNRLADVLRGVVAQTLVWRDPPGGRVPECEILVANHAVRSILRQNQLFKLVSAMEIGVRDGMSTRERYRRWLDKREVWSSPFSGGPAASERGGHASAASFAAPETRPAAAPGRPATPRGAPTDGPAARVASEPPTPTEPGASDEVIVIEPVDESLADIVSELEKD